METENIGPFWFGVIYELVCFLDWYCDATGPRFGGVSKFYELCNGMFVRSIVGSNKVKLLKKLESPWGRKVLFVYLLKRQGFDCKKSIVKIIFIEFPIWFFFKKPDEIVGLKNI